ncbi:MAG: glycosyltransferase family 4 protein [Bacteroidales bacterium]|nr:glycosyltransferase family 4 protein [Bacteroidales bacterium]
MMKKVIVSVTNDLVTDQRVQRVCNSLMEWGYDILLVGRKLPESMNYNKPYQYKRMKLLFKRKFLFYAEFNFRLFVFLLFHKADILVSNDLDTLPANYLASKVKRCKIVFDSHEYFSETPEVYKRKFVRAFWLLIEKRFIRNLNGYYTVSQSVANIYKKKYNIDFEVIRNVPLQIKNKISTYISEPFIIYQGSVNVGRGLELIIKAMPLLRPLQLVIAGDGPEIGKLKDLTASLLLQDTVKFTGRLLPEELQEITYQAIAGISIEEPTGLSYISCLPNKLFDYIHAGIPVLVSNLPEMKALVTHYKIGLILEERSIEKMAENVKTLITDQDKRLTLEKKSCHCSSGTLLGKRIA